MRGLLGPLVQDLRQGGLAGLTDDLLAGTITALLLIPQALAYALLAGLPPQVGLYASVLPVLLYAVLGSSRTLAVGPVAVAAVMVSAALTPYAGDDPQKYLSGALILSALTGVILLGLGLLRLGWVANFISHPVLSGFTTGAALFIVGTQLSALTAIPVPRDAELPGIVRALVEGLGAFQPLVALFGLASLALLLLARRPLVGLLTRLGVAARPAALIARMAPLVLLLGATVVASLIGAAARGVPVVGAIPQGVPLPSLRFLAEPGWLVLLPSAALIALIGYVESLAVAKALAFRRRERIDPDRELVALGAANLGSAVAGAMPVAGGFARSMVNVEAGARSQLAAVVTAGWVLLGALFFTQLIAELPKAVLAALIVVAVWQLVDVESLKTNWRYDRAEGIAQLATLLGVLAFGIEPGLLIGAALAVGTFLYRTSRPHIAVVGRVPDSEHFRNIRRHPVQTFPGVLILRIDESLYFANVPVVEQALQDRILETPGLRAVILLMPAVNAIDASGLEMLEGLAGGLAARGVELHLAEVKGPVMDRLAGTPFLEHLGPARVHLSAQAAVAAVCGGPQG